MEKIYCHNCGEMREYSVRPEKEAFLVENESVSVEADVSHCKVCGNQVWNEELDKANLRKAQEKRQRR